MKSFKKLAILLLLSPLFVACSDAPAGSVVEELIKAQYEQAHNMTATNHGAGNHGAVSNASGESDKIKMPTLESVGDVKCGSAEGVDTYRCIAEITQSLDGKSETKKVNFLVYKFDDEWAIGG